MPHINNFTDLFDDVKYWLILPLLKTSDVTNHITILIITMFAVGFFFAIFGGFALLFPYILYLNLRKNFKNTLQTNKLLFFIGILISGSVYYWILNYFGFIGNKGGIDKFMDYRYKA